VRGIGFAGSASNRAPVREPGTAPAGAGDSGSRCEWGSNGIDQTGLTDRRIPVVLLVVGKGGPLRANSGKGNGLGDCVADKERAGATCGLTHWYLQFVEWVCWNGGCGGGMKTAKRWQAGCGTARARAGQRN